MKQAVFLDRDGVINRTFVRDGKPYPPADLEQFEILQGVEQAVSALRNAGFLIIVTTNQPDVTKGIQRREVVEAMHARLLAAGLCDDIMVCYHVAEDGCECRKPKPGMLVEAARRWEIDLTGSFMVGDRWLDVAAGKAAGCYTFFVDYNYREACHDTPDARVRSLDEASRLILQGLYRRGKHAP